MQRSKKQVEEERVVVEEEERVINTTYRVVEDLQSVGINVSDIKKLQEAGYCTIGQVLQSSSRDLVAIKGKSNSSTLHIFLVVSQLNLTNRIL